jgi:hypothetical protein
MKEIVEACLRPDSQSGDLTFLTKGVCQICIIRIAKSLLVTSHRFLIPSNNRITITVRSYATYTMNLWNLVELAFLDVSFSSIYEVCILCLCIMNLGLLRIT